MPTDSARDARDYRLFIVATILLSLGGCINSSLFNNYLKDVYDLDFAKRAFLEFPRELPGFLVTFFVASLAALGQVRIAMVAQLAASAGMLALGWIPSQLSLMVASAFIYSAGQHVYMPLANSIGMGFAESGREGRGLGRVSSIGTIALLSGSAVLLLCIELFKPSYRASFTVSAILYLAAAMVILSMSPRKARGKTRRLVLKRRYARFYVLSSLYGARKQLFITFGPWMLVDLFGANAATMTLLFFVISAVGIGAQPIIGKLTDRLGPRAVLGGEAILTVGVCLVYAFAPGLLPRGVAFGVIAGCYVIDQASASVTMSRAVFVRQIAEEDADVAPTLSLGISIDHSVAMFLPSLGGLVCSGGGIDGYRWIFLGGACVSLANFFVTRGMPRKALAQAA
jgi:MFS family permease